MRTAEKNIETKKAQCLVCGKKGVVKIRKSDRKILGHTFEYFGKFDLNSIKRSKYLYEVLFDKNNKMLLNKDGSMKVKKIKNEEYVTGTKPKYINYWECETCYKEPENK
jgi:DNA-directed RNA polymerase subunit RPC12/RpoP